MSKRKIGVCLVIAILSVVAIGVSGAAGAAVPESPFGFAPAAVNQDDYTGALQVGVKWTRPSLGANWCVVQPDLARKRYDFSQLDAVFGAVPSDLMILANIGPEISPVADTGYALPGSYLPVDTDKYVAFVKAAVERYDGDGIDDLPGLGNPIRYWQVGNEPDSSVAGDFDQLQRITYLAIKEACPACTVLIGGVGGMPPVDQYLRNFDMVYGPILTALRGQYVDVMDFHWYGAADGDYRGSREVSTHVRNALDAAGFPAIPIWITEMGAYSGDPVPQSAEPIDYPPQTETQQASDYFKRFVYSLTYDAEKVFPAYGFMEGFTGADGYFDHTGLLYDGIGPDDPGVGVKKLGYYTYQKMTEMLEGSDWGSVQVIRDSGQVFICRAIKSGKPIFIVWWDYFDDPTYYPGAIKRVPLSGLTGTAAIVTDIVPRFSSGAEISSYGTAFRRRRMVVSRGRAALTLGSSPVIIQAP